MYLVASDYAKPSHGWTGESLAAALRVPREFLEPILANLSASELLVMASEKRLIPGRDPHHVTLRDIVAAVRGRNRDRIESSEAWRGGINDIVDRMDDAIAAQLGDRTLGQLVDAHIDHDETH
jgi:DNA-binding IscR family transcriptional regulator